MKNSLAIFWSKMILFILLMTTSLSLYQEGSIISSVSVTVLAIYVFIMALIQYEPKTDN